MFSTVYNLKTETIQKNIKDTTFLKRKMALSIILYFFFFFLRCYLFTFREGEGREKEREIDQLPLTRTQPRTWSATQACALTGNRTGDPLAHRPALSPLSHPSSSAHSLFLISHCPSRVSCPKWVLPKVSPWDRNLAANILFGRWS